MNFLKNKTVIKFTDNVEYQVRDAQGNIKPVFQENKLAQALLKVGILNASMPKIRLFGKWADKKVVSNLVTTAGKALVAGLINGSGTPAAVTYIAVGTGTNAAAAGDTALQTETATSGLSRAAATVSLVTTTTTNDTAQLTKTFSVSGTVAVTESGCFNAASTGTMLNRQVFSAINVANGDTLAVTHKITVS